MSDVLDKKVSRKPLILYERSIEFRLSPGGFRFFFALLHFFRGFDFLSREEYFFIQQINFSQAKNEAFRKGN